MQSVHSQGSNILPLLRLIESHVKQDHFVKPVCWITQSCLTLCNPMDCSPPGSIVHRDSPGKNTGVGLPCPPPGDLPNQGSNPGLPDCRWILYCLSQQRSLWLLEWAVYPSSRGFSWPRNQTRVFCIAGRFFTSWATRAALVKPSRCVIFQIAMRSAMAIQLIE